MQVKNKVEEVDEQDAQGASLFAKHEMAEDSQVDPESGVAHWLASGEGGDGGDPAGEGADEVAALHEDLHFELYGNTPVKEKIEEKEDEIEEEKSLPHVGTPDPIEDISSDDEEGKQEKKQPTAGSQKDRLVNWFTYMTPKELLPITAIWINNAGEGDTDSNVDIITPLCLQDRVPLTKGIAELPDSALRSQVFIQVANMKALRNDEDLLEADWLASNCTQ